MINARVTCRFERIGDFCSVAYLHILSNFKEIPEEIFLFVPDILFLIKRNPVRLCGFEFDRFSQKWIRVYTCEEARLNVNEIRIKEELAFLSQICASPCYSSLFSLQRKGRDVIRNIHAPVERQDGRYAIPLLRDDYDYTLLSQLVKEIEQQCGIISLEKEFLCPNGFVQLDLDCRSVR